MKSKFNILFEEVMNELQVKNVKYFDTFQQARDFLNKNFNGHGTILSKDNKCLETCRCMARIHQSMNIPKIIVNLTEDEYFEHQRQKFKDDPILREMFEK